MSDAMMPLLFQWKLLERDSSSSVRCGIQLQRARSGKHLWESSQQHQCKSNRVITALARSLQTLLTSQAMSQMAPHSLRSAPYREQGTIWDATHVLGWALSRFLVPVQPCWWVNLDREPPSPHVPVLLHFLPAYGLLVCLGYD